MTRTTLATILPVTAVMIDRSSAVVKPKGRYLELAVRRTAPDSVYRGAAATRARKERDEIACARQQAVKAQEESAKQMTERFRSPS